MENQKYPKGKILKVKNGYNPNSSSVGSQIPVFLFLGLGSGIFAITIAQTLNAIDKWIQEKKERLKN